MVALDVQLASTHADWPTLREASLRAERAGFDVVWVFDHRRGVTRRDNCSLSASRWPAHSPRTSTIELGVMVANAWNRRGGRWPLLPEAENCLPSRLGAGFVVFGGVSGAAINSMMLWCHRQHDRFRIDIHLECIGDGVGHAHRRRGSSPSPMPFAPRGRKRWWGFHVGDDQFRHLDCRRHQVIGKRAGGQVAIQPAAEFLHQGSAERGKRRAPCGKRRIE